MSGTSPSHQTVKLARGWHATPEDGACVVELASMLAGEPFSDRPQSVCRLIGALLRAYNDIAGDRRQDLYECAAIAVGTRGSYALERRRIDHALTVVDELEDAGPTGALRRLWPFSTMAGRLRGLVATEPVPATAIDQFGGGLARLLRRRGDDGHDRVLRLVAELAAMRDAPTRTSTHEGATMSLEDLEQFDDMGPIDYVILEWEGDRPNAAEVAPLLLDLVDRGIVRILDIAFIAKDADGSITAIDLEHLEDPDGTFAAFDGASSGMLDFEDVQDAGSAMQPGTCAAVLVWENRWAMPVARALRKSGGQLVASGRIPVQAILAALEAAEAPH